MDPNVNSDLIVITSNRLHSQTYRRTCQFYKLFMLLLFAYIGVGYIPIIERPPGLVNRKKPSSEFVAYRAQVERLVNGFLEQYRRNVRLNIERPPRRRNPTGINSNREHSQNYRQRCQFYKDFLRILYAHIDVYNIPIVERPPGRENSSPEFIVYRAEVERLVEDFLDRYDQRQNEAAAPIQIPIQSPQQEALSLPDINSLSINATNDCQYDTQFHYCSCMDEGDFQSSHSQYQEEYIPNCDVVSNYMPQNPIFPNNEPPVAFPNQNGQSNGQNYMPTLNEQNFSNGESSMTSLSQNYMPNLNGQNLSNGESSSSYNPILEKQDSFFSESSYASSSNSNLKKQDSFFSESSYASSSNSNLKKQDSFFSESSYASSPDNQDDWLKNSPVESDSSPDLNESLSLPDESRNEIANEMQIEIPALSEEDLDEMVNQVKFDLLDGEECSKILRSL